MSQVTAIRNTRSLREKMLAGRAKRNQALRGIRLDDASEEAGEDVIVQVRRFELGERAVYFGAPESMSDRIAKRTKDYARIMSKHNLDLSAGANMSMMGFMLAMTQEPEFEEIANTVCLAAFVDPPLVETEAEQQANPDAWLVSDLTLADRISVFYQLQNKVEAKQEDTAMARFRQEPDADVESASGSGDVRPATERSDGVEGVGLVE